MKKGSPTADSIIEILKTIRGHPVMFLGRDNDVQGTLMYLRGFSEACAALGFLGDFTIYQQILEQRNLSGQPKDILKQMRDRGLDNRGIVHEMIAIEIEKWQKVVEKAD